MVNGTSQNTNLNKARKAKQDEFYTRLYDIENELNRYKKHLAGKVVYCNCDDPRVSKFFHYFAHKFEILGLKKLITTCYKNQNPDMFTENKSEKAIYIEYKRDENGHLIPYPEYMQSITGIYKGGKDELDVLELNDIGIGRLKGDGDFRSPECVALLKQADIVVTNPPFSLFREYVAQLVEHDKKFVIIGNKNAITYKEIFQLIKENKMWVGNTPMGTDMLFDLPKDVADELVKTKKEGSGYKIVKGDVRGRSQAVWFTNLDIPKRHEDLILYKKYNPEEYPKYDNYDAIEVSKTKEIPMGYGGVMAVPVSFLDKYNPAQFEIIWTTDRGGDGNLETLKLPHHRYDAPIINGRGVFKRILIKNRRI